MAVEHDIKSARELEHKETASSEEDTNVLALAEHVAYGPDGLRGLVSSNYVFWVSFLASLGGFSFGYDQGVISIINVMDQFHNAIPGTKSAFGKSFMTSMLQLGSFFGVLVFPWIADKISRKRAILLVVVIFTIGAILQTSAQTYSMLVIGRAIGGIGVGTLAMVCWRLCISILKQYTDDITGCPPLHLRDRPTQPPWYTSRPRIDFNRHRRCHRLLDHLRHKIHDWRNLLPPPSRPTDGLCHHPRRRSPVLPLLSPLARSRRSQRRMPAITLHTPPPPSHRPPHPTRVHRYPRRSQIPTRTARAQTSRQRRPQA